MKTTQSATNLYKVKFGIRQKLFILILIAFTALVLTTSWRIGIEARKGAATAIDRSLAQSSIILETKLNSRFASISEIVIGLAKDGRVFPLVYEGESLTLQDLSLEFKKVLDFDILIITDDEGSILARSDRPEAIGQSIAGRSELFDAALDGREAKGIIAIQGQLLQTVVVPIFDNFAPDIVRGTVALAYELSPAMAEETVALTASQIGFFIFNRNDQREVDSVSATYNTNRELGPKLESWFNNQEQNWQSIYNADKTSPNFDIRLDDELFLSVAYPLRAANGNNLGFVLASQSQTELLKPFTRIQQQVVFVGVICLVLASLFAWVFSQRITRPIINLVTIANKIREGQYPEKRLTRKQNDEVDVLFNAINHMGSSLKEKAELENYLAQLSEDLDENDSIVSSSNLLQGMEQDASQRKEPEGDTTIISEDEDKTISSQKTQLSTKTSTTNSRQQINIGTVIANRYEMIKLIGVGAMGEVFLAKDRDLDENIAIKFLSNTNFTPEIFTQFKEEIRLARQITHRNILRTFDFGAYQKPYYITMEYVQGYDLGQLIKKKGPLEPHIGIALAKQICTAMYAAHQQGIIHRDLKPANMMINRQGILKIMDFGLAMKVSRKAKGKAKTQADSEKTTIAGTPRYMAPEQFYGTNLDERTDIYAIGAILFTLFSGRPPFMGKNFEEFAKLHAKVSPPKLLKLVPNAPPELEFIIEKALQKNPGKRFSSVREMLDQLQVL